MVKYETIFILRTDTSEDGVEKLKQRFHKVIEKFNGVPLRFENWGKRKLAYEVKNNPKGIFFYFNYISRPGTVEEIHRQMSVIDNILRYQTMRVEKIADMSKVDIEKEKATPSRFSTSYEFTRGDYTDEPEPEYSRRPRYMDEEEEEEEEEATARDEEEEEEESEDEDSDVDLDEEGESDEE